MARQVKRALPKASARFAAVFGDQKAALGTFLEDTPLAPEGSGALACPAICGVRPFGAPEGEEVAAEDLPGPGGVGGGGGDGGRAAVAAFETFATALDKCLRDLRAYADGKRADFPRFFFLSNRELLDVLANGAEPDKVCRHLPKMFIETARLDLVPPPPDATDNEASEATGGGGGGDGDDRSRRSEGTKGSSKASKVCVGVLPSLFLSPPGGGWTALLLGPAPDGKRVGVSRLNSLAAARADRAIAPSGKRPGGSEAL